MTDNSFWLRCVNARCVIVPIPTYSQYSNENTSKEHFLGIKYAWFPFDDQAVGPEYWFMLDESQSGSDALYGSPEEALNAREKSLEQT